MADGGNGERSIFESMLLRLVAPVIGALLLGALGWMMSAIVTNSSNIAAIQAEIPLRTASRYTAEDAKRDQDRVSDRFAYDEHRLDIVEGRRRE